MSDTKYITFKRDELMAALHDLGATTMIGRCEDIELIDAVVIRRRDLFASPCLATYANMIALVANNITDLDQGNELMAIADYFERQAGLAADEGHKLPSI
jgi:hypothetical protein